MFFWNLKSAIKEIILTLLLFDYSVPLLRGEERRGENFAGRRRQKLRNITLR
jgi:hypothetical protein